MEKLFGVINESTQEISCINFTCGQFADEVTLCLGKEYEVKVENGKTIVAKKKPKYPTTYDECCDVLSIAPYYNLRYYTYEHGYNEYATTNKLCSLQDKLNILGKLLICRNAYWNIVGEQMGLGKPWEPESIEMSHAIVCRDDGEFLLHRRTRAILIFPTEEMRDAFYENFKDLINSCKELL